MLFLFGAGGEIKIRDATGLRDGVRGVEEINELVERRGIAEGMCGRGMMRASGET